MKKIILIRAFLFSLLASAQNTMPHLDGGKLIVDSEPYVMLAGELHNSSTGSLHKMEGLWEKMAGMNLNTVIAPVSWELCEPEEGCFDFSLLDAIVRGARQNDLRVVLIWFGSWKNGTSTYVPSWVKQNQKRFPLARTKLGYKLNAVSALGENTMKADAKAFAAMMRHLKEMDGDDHTVILVQVENEMGTLRDTWRDGDRASRDFSPMAQKAFKSDVPSELISYLKQNEKNLHPALLSAWKSQEKRTRGTWEDVFGESLPTTSDDWQNAYPYLTDEIFNAWNYASYVEYVAAAGKKEYALPMYVNDWLKQKGQEEPGLYPSGAAQPHLYDIWKAAAPDIDFYAPDIYAVDSFDWVLQTHSFGGNSLFIPETDGSSEGASRALYAFGRYPLMGYSPFGVDGGSGLSVPEGDPSFPRVYALLKQIMPRFQHYRDLSCVDGLFVDKTTPECTLTMDGIEITASVLSPYSRMLDMIGTAVDGEAFEADPLGVLVIRTGTNEFLVAGGVGNGYVRFSKPGSRLAYLSVDLVEFDENGRELTHRLNGDEIYADIVFPKGQATLYHVKLYEL